MNRSQTNTAPARNVRADALVSQMHRHDRAAVARAIAQQDMAELERAGIARRIKQARQEAGLSQPEMADALGVIARTYQNYEAQEKPRTPWSLMNQIATVTGKSTEWLIHGDRPTPDVLGIASSDQVGDIRSEFRADVTQIEQRLDDIQQSLRAATGERMYAVELIEQQNQLLARQSKILEGIEKLVAVLQDAEVIERSAAAAVRSLPEWPAPPRDDTPPARTVLPATGTSDREGH